MKLLWELTSELNRLFVFELADRHRVEAVFYRGDTLCLSTQVGCAIGCPFCLSGSKGLVRNLTVDEILGQYLLLKDKLNIRRIAFAGIGEPLMNWDSVKTAFWHFARSGLGVSFYTTGYPTSKLRELLHLPHRGVSISLHSLKKDLREKLLPHCGSLAELIKVLEEELSKLSTRKRKKVSLAYLLLKGVNDQPEDLTMVAELAKRLRIGITLLRYNNTGEGFYGVDDEEYERAFLFLKSYGLRVTLSTRFRRDRLGGCGTLMINREGSLQSV